MQDPRGAFIWPSDPAENASMARVEYKKSPRASEKSELQEGLATASPTGGSFTAVGSGCPDPTGGSSAAVGEGCAYPTSVGVTRVACAKPVGVSFDAAGAAHTAPTVAHSDTSQVSGENCYTDSSRETKANNDEVGTQSEPTQVEIEKGVALTRRERNRGYLYSPK